VRWTNILSSTISFHLIISSHQPSLASEHLIPIALAAKWERRRRDEKMMVNEMRDDIDGWKDDGKWDD